MIDKRWFFVGLFAVGVFLVVVLLLPFFLNADSFRSTLETQLSNTLGRTVTVGKLTFSLVHGSLTADEIVISDDPAFSDVPFVQAKKFDVGIEIIPFIVNREVRITGLTIDTPSIQLIEHANGRWNYSSLGSSNSPSTPSEQPASSAKMSVGQLKIVNGSALVSSVPQTANPFAYSDVNLTVRQFSFLKSFPFELSAKLPGNGTLNLTGEAGPITAQDTSQTPFHGKLQVREFDPAAAGIVEQSKGISMVNDVDGDVASDGAIASCTGKIKASQLKLAPKGAPAQEPVDIDYSVSRNLTTREGIVSDIAIHAGSSEVHVTGTFKPSPEGMMLNLHLSAPSLPIDQLERLLPVVGVRLPSGSSLEGGTLTANIAISGPATTATMTGPVEVNNTRLAGFDLGSKIDGLSPIAGTGGGTDIRVLKANVNSSPQSTRLSSVFGEMPQIGTANGEGNVAPSGELDFHLTAKLNGSNVVGSLANQALNKAGGAVGGRVQPNAKPNSAADRVISLTITGTAASPSIQTNLGSTLR